MCLYYDLITAAGQLYEDETFSAFASARDVAFDLAQELGQNIHIRENYGLACNVVEIVEA